MLGLNRKNKILICGWLRLLGKASEICWGEEVGDEDGEVKKRNL